MSEAILIPTSGSFVCIANCFLLNEIKKNRLLGNRKILNKIRDFEARHSSCHATTQTPGQDGRSIVTP